MGDEIDDPEDLIAALVELVRAITPFTSGDVVDETGGTLLLIDRAMAAIDDAAMFVGTDEDPNPAFPCHVCGVAHAFRTPCHPGIRGQYVPEI